MHLPGSRGRQGAAAAKEVRSSRGHRPGSRGRAGAAAAEGVRSSQLVARVLKRRCTATKVDVKCAVYSSEALPLGSA